MDFLGRSAQRDHRRRSIFRSRCSSASSSWCCAARTRTSSRSARSISASSSMPRSFWSRTSSGTFRGVPQIGNASGRSCRRAVRRRSDPRRRQWPRLERPAADHLDQRVAGRQGRLFLDRDHRGRLRSAVHHARRRRPDFQPDGAHLRLRADRRAARHIYGHALLASLLLPEHIEEAETIVVRALRRVYTPLLRWSLGTALRWWRSLSRAWSCLVS